MYNNFYLCIVLESYYINESREARKVKKVKTLKGIDSFDELINGYIKKSSLDKRYTLEIGKTEKVAKFFGEFNSLELAEERFYNGIRKFTPKRYIYKV